MKENKQYPGMTNSDVGRGFSRTQEVKNKDPSDDHLAKQIAEMFEEPEGFLERQNVYERI